MVILGEDREREAEKLMAKPPERSKPLHNFPIPSSWGAQRHLKCSKVNPNGEFTVVDRKSTASEVERGFGNRKRTESERRGSSDRRESFKVSPSPAAVVGCPGRKSALLSDADDGIEAVRTKLMFDLQTAADQMKDAILREGLEAAPPAPAVPADNKVERPWNLRTRRAACKEPNGRVSGGGNDGCNDGGGKSSKADMLKPNFSPLRTECKSSRLRGSVIGGTAVRSGEKRERAKFSLTLTRQEIEEDYLAMTGRRPLRRPKKRAKNVQKGLDTLVPGLWLPEVNADIYKVPDAPDSGKR